MSTCSKITEGFDNCAFDPIAEGIEDAIFLFNNGDFIFTFDPNNPLIITGILPVNGAKMFKYLGSNNSFNTISKSVRTNVGTRFTEEITFNIAGLSSAIKGQLIAMGNGNLQAIVINNYKDQDSVIELFGAVNGLQDDGSERNAADENFGGGYNMKLTNRPKLREPMPPRCINIPIFAPGIAGTPPVVNTAKTATLPPTGVAVVGSTTGGSLAAATYFYKIVSVDAQGTTVGSAEVTVTNTGATSSNSLTWAGAPGAVSYRVYRGTVTNTENVYYTTNTTNFVDTGAANTGGAIPTVGTATKATATPGAVTATGSATGGALPAATYYYVITAIDAQGETLASSEVSYVATGTASSVMVAWGAVVNAVTYKVYRGTAAGQENVYFNTAALDFLDTNVTQPATYLSTLAAIEALAV